jgi:hypothetical protein
MAIGLITHQDLTTRPEDVVDLVTNLDYKSTPFLSMLPEGTAQNTLHEWLTDTYDASADNAAAEGSEATVVDHTVPARKTNVVQLFRKVISVSDTQRAIPHYGTGDPYTYQTRKKMVETARDMEKALVQGTRASGASGVARRMDGAIALITTNKTARTSGTSLSETEFNDIIAGVYDAGTDENVTDVLVGSYLKRVVSGFTQGVTKNIDVERKKLVRRVDVYESDFGVHAIHLSREVPAGGVLAVDISKWRMDWLVNRRLAISPLGKTGSNTKSLMEGEATLAALNEKSSAYRAGYFVG